MIHRVLTAVVAALGLLLTVTATPVQADPINLRAAAAQAIATTLKTCQGAEYVQGTVRAPYRAKVWDCRDPRVLFCRRWFHPSVGMCVGVFELRPTVRGQQLGYRPLQCDGALIYQTHRRVTRRIRRGYWDCRRDRSANRAGYRYERREG